MKMVTLQCHTCKKTLQRYRGRVNESKKFGWKTYCSLDCQNSARYRHQEKICENFLCQKSFIKKQSEIRKSSRHFCSQSCAAYINNLLRGLRGPKKVKPCTRDGCKNLVSRHHKFCSANCQMAKFKIPIDIRRKTILERIRAFYKEHQRIPLKREMYELYKIARNVFGTWNAAVAAAGFEPNPVLFARRQTAKDGHTCDSVAEKIIDDWFADHNIKHERNAPYYVNRMTADFRVGYTFIEFFGLHGEIERYDANMNTKEEVCDVRGLRLIKLFPKDLYTKGRLDELLLPLATK